MIILLEFVVALNIYGKGGKIKIQRFLSAKFYETYAADIDRELIMKAKSNAGRSLQFAINHEFRHLV